ncbi:NAD-dependent epimerase/dehydratase family protein [Blastococcus sp. SYSU DS0533]
MPETTARRFVVTGGSGFIGTTLVRALRTEGHEVVNLDLVRPNLAVDDDVWRQGDVLDAEAVGALVAEHRPHAVIHLAARTDTLSDDLAGYAVNVDGTRNVVEAMTQHVPGARLVHTSTQFVLRPGRDPVTDDLYDPHTTYGRSKAISEDVVRAANGLSWVITRPTNIWGPWHPRYPVEFWRVLERGLYLHPSRPVVRRSYGYVENVADQFIRCATLGDDRVGHRTLYLGDAPLVLDDWVDGFSQELLGRPARRVPLAALAALARVGDLASRAGVRAPLTSSRLASMTQDYVVPMDPTFAALRIEQPISLQEGIRRTVAWLRSGERSRSWAPD